MNKQNGLIKAGLLYIVGIAMVIAALSGMYLISQDHKQAIAKESDAKQAEMALGPMVTVATATMSPPFRKLLLVGEALPAKTATVYAKTSGYLKTISVNVGDVVKQGQAIAEIDSPETDQQYNRVVADLENKRRIADRTRELAQQNFFSKQASEIAQTDVRVAQAAVGEQTALKAYRILRAPFAGTVTARHADPGTLITNATSNQSSAQPIVTVADISKLKVSVYAEQSEAPFMKIGTPVQIADASNTQRTMSGAITRVSGELDPKTRSLLAEIDVTNADGKIIPGSFVNVTVEIPAQSFTEVPSTALVMRDKKPHLAIVSADNKIRFQPIIVANTDGKILRVSEGLQVNEKVALSLSASTAEGSPIRPAPPEKK